MPVLPSADRAQYIGSQPHYSNIVGSLAAVAIGVGLAIIGPVFGFQITIGRLPYLVTQIAGGVIASFGLLGLVVMEKVQGTCKRCNAGLVDGEAAFPEELDAQTRPLVLACQPAPLMNAPVGSRFGNGTHFRFDYCPTCKSVGELTLWGNRGTSQKTRAKEVDRGLVVGLEAQQFVHICELHDRTRTANNSGN